MRPNYNEIILLSSSRAFQLSTPTLSLRKTGKATWKTATKCNKWVCISTCQGHSPYEAIPPPTILACLTNLLPQISLWFALGLNTSKSCCLSFRSMSVEALEPSSEVAELPNKPLKKTKNKNNYRGSLFSTEKYSFFVKLHFPKNKRNIWQNSGLTS